MSLAEAGVSDPPRRMREGEAVLGGRLLGLGLGAGLDDLGDGPRRLGGAEADLLELADRQVVELVLVVEQPPDRVDDLGRADVAIELEVPGDLRGGVGLADVGRRGPVGLARRPSRAAASPGRTGRGRRRPPPGSRRRRAAEPTVRAPGIRAPRPPAASEPRRKSRRSS